MRFPAYIALLAATAVGHAHAVVLAAGPVASQQDTGFTVPTGQANGVYSVSYGDDGTVVHSFIGRSLTEQEFAAHQAEERDLAAREVSQASDSPALFARQSDATYCGSSERNLDAGQHNRAIAALKFQCNPSGTISQGRDFYSIDGGVVAYICNYGSNNWPCSSAQITKDVKQISDACGSHIAGWRVRWIEGNTGAQTGAEVNWAKFCGRGTSG